MKTPQLKQQIFRYWVEIRELANGSVRELPVSAVTKICLARRKKNEPPIPNQDLLQVKDGAETLEAESFDELRACLRDKYPDVAFERTLHYVRDREAEERRERALNGLAELLAKAAVDKMIEEETRGRMHFDPAPAGGTAENATVRKARYSRAVSKEIIRSMEKDVELIRRVLAGDTMLRTGPGENDRTDLRETLKTIVEDLERCIRELKQGN